jgi:sugar lactone lactonase YvrE
VELRVRLLALILIVLILAVVAVVVVWTMSSSYWVVAAKQMMLTPWLRPAYLGDGRPASALLLCYPIGLAINRAGELLISDRGRGRGRVVWRIDAKRNARIVAGTGRPGKATESWALKLNLERPTGLAVAADGSVFLSDGFNHSVYRIEPDGRVGRVAGTGSPGFFGDGGIASHARLFRPADIRVDGTGNLFIADARNHRVRKVDPSGRITTVAGTGEPGFAPDGTPAVRAQLDTPWGLGLDSQNRLLIADSANHRVRRVEHDGRLTTLAGTGRQGFDGDGRLATEASLRFPENLFVDSNARLFIGDKGNHAVRVVGTDGIISTVIGTGFPGRALIGGVARQSPLDNPENILVVADGLIIADANNGRVIRISDDGIVHLVAGRGEIGPCTPDW